MFIIKSKTNILCDLNINNAVFTQQEARPSKTIISSDKYKLFMKLSFEKSIFDEYSIIYEDPKGIEYYLCNEIVNKIDKYRDYIDSIEFSINNICINETPVGNLIFNISNKLKLKSLVSNFNSLIDILNYKDTLILNIVEQYSYPSAEYIYTISQLFKKVIIYYSFIFEKTIFIGIDYIRDDKIITYLKNIEQNWKNNFYIRQFGITIPNEYISDIYDYNDYIFDYYLDKNNRMKDTNINIELIKLIQEEKKYLHNNHLKKLKLCKYINKCNHELIKCVLNEYHICKKCGDFFDF